MELARRPAPAPALVARVARPTRAGASRALEEARAMREASLRQGANDNDDEGYIDV